VADINLSKSCAPNLQHLETEFEVTAIGGDFGVHSLKLEAGPMCSHFVMLMLIKEATGIAGGAGGCQSSPTPNGKGRQALLFLEATVGIALFPKLRAN